MDLNESTLCDEDCGEDLMITVETDYAAIPELDEYDADFIDRREFPENDASARFTADAEIEQRLHVKLQGLHNTLSAYARSSGPDQQSTQVFDDLFSSKKYAVPTPDTHGVGQVNIESMSCPLREWIAQHRIRSEIKRRFTAFLLGCQTADGTRPYMDRIKCMCAKNYSSLCVSYRDLSFSIPVLALWVADAPRDVLEILDEVANELILSSDHFPSYNKIANEVHVRIAELPILDGLKSLRRTHLNKLVRVHGVVARRSRVFPQLRLVKFTCVSCRARIGPFKQSNNDDIKPSYCTACHSEGPFTLCQQETVYRNYQTLSLQEVPGMLPPGHVPRQKEVVLLDDLIDVVRPGEDVEVTGIYAHSYHMWLSDQNGYPIVSTAIECNHIARRDAVVGMAGSLTADERKGIILAGRDPTIMDRLVTSLAPSIYGQRFAKKALALALFGGCSKNVEGKHRIRGDINVMLLGDPGCAKSQLLKYCCSLIPRAVYTTGKGASAVGLTAGVHKDVLTKEWTLEGGALVLADNAVCCIDEFDKMSEQDRTSIHEAMEQQSISVSKAGIVTSLEARCSVIAAANPIGGQYEPSLAFAENVELTDPIMQRFDILCILQDVIDPILDSALAQNVVNSHRLSCATATKRDTLFPPVMSTCNPDAGMSQNVLRSYVAYARSHCKPGLLTIDQTKISCLYAELRRESVACGGVPIAVRHLESLIRIAEAHARMGLREFVCQRDLDGAISVLVSSFIAAQKLSVRKLLERGFNKFIVQCSDHFDLLLHTLRALVCEAQAYAVSRPRRIAHVTLPRQDPLIVPVEELLHKVQEYDIHATTVAAFLESPVFRNHSFTLDHVRQTISWSCVEH